MNELNQQWVPEGVEKEKSSAARIYDYLLGGFHNFQVDRQAGDVLLTINPHAKQVTTACRAFLRRVVRYMLSEGIHQFLDIGSGIPTVGNVHEIAQEKDATNRVVYVDIDPVAVAHSKAILEGNQLAVAIKGDIQEPEKILENEEVKKTIDFEKPIGLLLLTMLHYVMDDDVLNSVLGRLFNCLPSGSMIAIAHSTTENAPEDLKHELDNLANKLGIAIHYRDLRAVEMFFDPLELVEPGVVFIPSWYPESTADILYDHPERALSYGGVAIKK